MGSQESTIRQIVGTNPQVVYSEYIGRGNSQSLSAIFRSKEHYIYILSSPKISYAFAVEPHHTKDYLPISYPHILRKTEVDNQQERTEQLLGYHYFPLEFDEVRLQQLLGFQYQRKIIQGTLMSSSHCILIRQGMSTRDLLQYLRLALYRGKKVQPDISILFAWVDIEQLVKEILIAMMRNNLYGTKSVKYISSFVGML